MANAIGQAIPEIFPVLARDLPKTAAAIRRSWPNSSLVGDFVAGEWLLSIVSIRQDSNLYLQLATPDEPIEGPQFDLDHQMLPLRWRALYRGFNSIAISEESVQPSVWRNTPFSFAGRMSVWEYAEQIGVTAKQAGSFQRRTGSSSLYCWLWSDNGDAFFLDDNGDGNRVFHVKDDGLREFSLVRDPEKMLDQYLAHVIDGHGADSFPFGPFLESP